MVDAISNFGQYDPQGQPTYDPNAGRIDEELKNLALFNPQYNMLKANIDTISIFPRQND